MLWFDFITGSLFISVGIVLSIIILTKNKQTFYKNLLLVLTIAVSLILSNIYIDNHNNGILKLYINFIILIILLKSIYNTSFETSTVMSFLITLLVVISEFVFSLIIILLKIDLNKILLLPISYCITNLSISVIMCAISRIKIFNYVFNKSCDILRKNVVILIFVIVFGLDSLLLKNINKIGYNTEYIVNFTLLVIFVIIIYFLLIEKFNNINISHKYDQLVENMSRYEQIINDQNKISHEFKNQLAVINGYVLSKNEKLKEYIRSILDEVKEFDPFFMKEIVKIPTGGLKGLIYYKLYDINSKKLNLDIKVDGRKIDLTKKVTIQTYKNITKIIGVFIDNAIQAAEQSEKKVIYIYIKSSPKNYIINISNSYNKSLKFEKIGEGGFTTKGKNRGYGLSLVADIIKKDKVLNTEKKNEDNLFTQILYINFK